MIIKDPIMYKTYLKNHEEISIKLRIIKHRIVDKLAINNISFKYSMHRNSVRNIMNIYNKKVPLELKKIIESNISLTSTDMSKFENFLKSSSRKPKSHSKQANSSEEKQIIDCYEKTKV